MNRTPPRRFLVALALAAGVAAVLALAAPSLAAERLLVLPLQPPYPGRNDLGPAVQNVIECAAVLNPAFEETYFLSHSRNLFASAGDLEAYIEGLKAPNFPLRAAKADGTRFVVGGRTVGDVAAVVWLTDLSTGATSDTTLTLDVNAGLVEFRRGVIEFLDRATNLPFPPDQAAKALKPLATSLAALKIFGRSNGSYQILSRAGARTSLDLDLAQKAIAEAPRSYLANNMGAWEYYVMGGHDKARELFRTALAADPDGIDALDGMLHLAAIRDGQDAATPWALRKARARGEGIGPALAQMHDYLGIKAQISGLTALAAWHYRKAVALYPDGTQSCLNLAWALSRMGRHLEAQKALDARLARPASPGMQATLLNREAIEARLEALSLLKSGDAGGERRCLDKALALLAKSPYPSSFEKWLCGFELARNYRDADDPSKAEEILLGLPRLDDISNMRGLLALALCRMALKENPDEVRTVARLCLRDLAERDRVGEPAPPDLFETLAKVCEGLGDADMAASLKRQAEARTAGMKKPG